MATSHFQHPPTDGKLLVNPRPEPSPPEENIHSKNTNASPSPTSPDSTMDSQQMYPGLKPPRKPLGMPAALRPRGYYPQHPAEYTSPRATNIPNYPKAPDTPLASKDNSFDSKKSQSFMPFSIDFAFRRRSKQEDPEDARYSGKGREISINHKWPKVTGPPTKANWKPDKDFLTCALCNVPFTFFNRRHHCRKCGNVVCANDLKHEVPLGTYTDRCNRSPSNNLQCRHRTRHPVSETFPPELRTLLTLPLF